jgi:hypothetical protein
VKLSDARKAYYDLSGTGSTVARQLAFAGIALVWVFRAPGEDTVVLPAALWLPTIFLVSGLALDMLHYLCSAAVWGAFHRINEKRFPDEPDREVEAPHWLNWPALVAFWGKASSIALAYLLLLRFAVRGVSFGG